MKQFLLAIDQGTTSSRAIVYRRDGSKAGLAQQEYAQHFPRDGWVEHEPDDIWQTTLASCRAALRQADIKADDVACIGITNQRETTVIWDRRTGQVIHRAIVWQDRRTAAWCQQLQRRLESEGKADLISSRTGLLLDSYFLPARSAGCWTMFQARAQPLRPVIWHLAP